MENLTMNYETNDLYLSGYLVATGIPLKSHTSANGYTIFRFEETDKLKKLVDEYYLLNAVINPQRFGSALKNLKNILYQGNNINHGNNYINNQQRKGN